MSTDQNNRRGAEARSVVAEDSQHALTRKVMVLTFHHRDWETLNTMLAAAQERIPDMDIQSVCSTLIAEACRTYRENNSASPRLCGEKI